MGTDNYLAACSRQPAVISKGLNTKITTEEKNKHKSKNSKRKNHFVAFEVLMSLHFLAPDNCPLQADLRLELNAVEGCKMPFVFLEFDFKRLDANMASSL